MAERPVKSLIMAAGMSTRMKSARNKVLHEVCGRRILDYVLDACRGAGIPRQVLVVGALRDQVMAAYAGDKDITWVVQEPQRGTGHAVMAAEAALGDFGGDLVVIVGDAAMIRTETVKTLLETHRRQGAAVTLVTAILEDPKWFGRIVRDGAGNLLRIVEARDATPAEYAIQEVNPSFYAFRWPVLRRVLGNITDNNVKKEYYLTDAVGLLIESGEKAVAVPAAQAEEVEAVNSREDLALVASLMRRRILKALMAAGVTVEDPATTYIDWNVTIGQDTVIGPCTVIRGPARIGRGCRVGPLAHVRAGSVLEDGAEVGAFVETKNARLGAGAMARHLSYLGDCNVGPRTNVGCRTITANFDGRKKHHTEVGAEASLGAGTLLVAPTSVGDGARTGAGAVVTRAHPVPPGETYVGVPARKLKGSSKFKVQSSKLKKKKSATPGRSRAKRAGSR
ncbi:MAG: NTP transferase domain-containing protein [Planctomycetota bacterium]|nr:NTP transferase domain-containing protein [Planctomycetota bacterium]